MKHQQVTALLAFAAVLTVSTAASAANFRDTKPVDDTLLKRHRFEIGIQSAGMWSSDKAAASADDGSFDTSSSTLYLSPAAVAGYMILNNLQGRIALGYLGVSATNDDISTQNFGGFLGTLQAVYHVPLRLGTALYLGGGGGYFTGSTSRPGLATNSTISNPTSGFAGQGSLGLLLQPGPMLLLRGGLRFDALVGTESSSVSAVPDLDTTNLKLLGEFSIGLRF